jgi:nucleoside-diphosphate-sugar epimerase
VSQQRRVLVTGATGFVGRHTLPILLSRGFEVHVVGRSAPVVDARLESEVVRHIADVLEPGESRRIMHEVRPSHLLHLAWYTVHGQFWQSTENLRWVSASLDLLARFAESKGSRCVFAGTCAEYEWTGRPLSEESPRRPASLYGVCKNALQETYAAAAKEYGVSAGWGRVFLPYGSHEDSRRVIPTAISRLLRGMPAEFSDGKQLRDFMHVEDLAAALVALLQSPHEGPMNLACGRPVELGEVLARIGHLTGRPELLRIGARPMRPGEPLSLTADVTLMKRSLSFEPRFDLDSGLRATVRWWTEQLDGTP